MPVSDHLPNFSKKFESFSDYLNDEIITLLPEYESISTLIEQGQGFMQAEVHAVLDAKMGKHKIHKLPLVGLSFGSQDIKAPTITFVGGIHGIERIGSQVILSYLHTLVSRAKWDSNFMRSLNIIRYNFLPVMNPVGMLKGTRSNGNGVDLMRNSPIDAQEKVPWFVGGQQLSRYLPWYRGNGSLECENQLLVDFLKQECLHRPFNLVLDCHSGFGFRDRLWIPYAYRKRPPRTVANYFALYQLWQQTYPHNNYVFEPQSRHYTTHGDLWDHVGKIVKHEFNNPFLSLTLEMGSWNWVKKSPKQMFSYQGLFNPNVEHRWSRVQRSHLVLFDFMTQAVSNYANWLPTNQTKSDMRKAAVKQWYRAT